MKKKFCIRLFLFFLLPVMIFAQGVTTGAFNGTVVSEDGSKLPGVLITAVHVPTGTPFTAVTIDTGTYYIPAVKVGGPYTFTAALDGFVTKEKKNIFVKLGENKQVDFMLTLTPVTEEVKVTGVIPIMNTSRTGASQNVVEDTIRNLPTISRSLDDFTRLAPQMVSDAETDGAFNAGGRSSRYNNIQIDGAQNNDLFGLGSTGTPGGQAEATVISLDAVQEFQVVLAPYDVRQGMFTGGGVNIITKSGTNDFHGSAYYWGRNESLMGKGPSDTKFNDFTEGTFGATLGGPLIKNKLFFFLNAENAKKSIPEDYYITGSGEKFDWGSKAEADRFISICQKYNYDPGSYDQVVNDRTSKKIFARLDWNINAKHRLTLRHSYNDSDYENLYRDDPNEFVFGNGGVIYLNKTNNTVLQLNSVFGKNINNELMINYQTIRDNPTYMGEAFPTIEVSIPGSKSFQAGAEEYRHRNQLDQDLIEITNNLTIYKGKHTFVLGTHNEFFNFYNVYIQREFGKYSFGSLDDFEAGKPSYFERYYSLTDDPKAPAEFNVYQLGLYAGDEWAVTPKLKLTLGLRADVPLMPETPPENPLVEEKFGIPTNQNAGGNVLWSPRLGFNFDPTGKQKLMFRGGVGIFSGRTPYVWISNQYSNTGTDLARYRVYYPTFFVTDPYGQPESPSGTPAPGDINLIDENYKFPQVLKTNIAVDAKLPFGFTGTVEFVYSKSINEIKYQNINIEPNGKTDAYSGRPLFGTPSTASYPYWGYPDYKHSEFQNVIYLTNTNKGFQYNLSFQLQKEWADGSMFNASYTYGMAKDLFGGTSSRAISNWGYNIITKDPNNPDLSYSAHDTRNRFFFTVSKKFNFIKNAPTTFAVVYDGRTGRRYCTRYTNDVNGDGRTNDSIFVPRNGDEIILTTGTWAEFDQYIKDDPALDAHRGQILPRYASTDPFYHQLDLKLTQAIPIPFLKGHKLEAFLTVRNFLNMLNKDWGVYRYILYDDSPITFEGYDAATGKPKFAFKGKTGDVDARYTINQVLSRWQMLFGFSYRF